VKGEHKLRPYEHLYNKVKAATRKKRIPMEMTFWEFLQFIRFSECHYCGAKLIWNPWAALRHTNAYNLDRKDNEEGYSYKNCVPCCARCNKGKCNVFSYEEWCVVGAALKTFREKTISALP
jgi:5-methylcytosine-specific restriction endonuclease McrA